MTKFWVFTVILTAMTYYSCQDQSYTQGQRLYDIRCSNCHMDDGSGLDNLIPDIRQSSYYHSRIDEFACLIYSGPRSVDSAQWDQTLAMPGQKDLTPSEISNIINYLLQKHTKSKEFFSDTRVKQNLVNCED